MLPSPICFMHACRLPGLVHLCQQTKLSWYTLVQGDDQPFIMILCSPWQLKMLKNCGQRLTMMDATGMVPYLPWANSDCIGTVLNTVALNDGSRVASGGVNSWGFMMTTMVVADPYQNGVPCASMVSSCEAAPTLQLFIETLTRAGAAFTFFMIDKSPTEMKAVQAAGYKYLLCKFHTMQAFERFLRTSQVGCLGMYKLRCSPSPA